jgi:hypothetical protein
MSGKRRELKPRNHVSDEFWHKMVTQVFETSESELKDALDKIDNLQPNRYINGGFRQFSSVPRFKLDGVSNKLWDVPAAQKKVIDLWMKNEKEIRDRVIDYLRVLGYCLKAENDTGGVISLMAPEHLDVGNDGKTKVIPDERWGFLDADTISAVAIGCGLIPKPDDGETEGLPGSVAHIPTRIAELKERADALRTKYAEAFGNMWPEAVIVPKGLADALKETENDAGRIWDEMHLSVGSPEDRRPVEFEELSQRWDQIVDAAVSRLDDVVPQPPHLPESFLEQLVKDSKESRQASEAIEAIIALKDRFPEEYGAIDRACEKALELRESIAFGEFVSPIAEPMATMGLDFRLGKELFDFVFLPPNDQAIDQSEDESIGDTEVVIDETSAPGLKVHDESSNSTEYDADSGPVLEAEEEQAEPEVVERTRMITFEQGVEALLKPEISIESSIPAIRSIAWELVRIREFGLARYLMNDYRDPENALAHFEWALHVANLASNLRVGGATGRIETRLRESVILWSSRLAVTLKYDEDRRAIGLLASGAYAYAAIVRPETDVASVLGDIGGHAGVEPWYEFVVTLQELRSRYPHVNIAQLRSSTERQEVLDRFTQRFEEWWQHAENKTFRYSGATELWRIMRSPDELIGQIAKNIRGGNSKGLTEIIDGHDTDRAIRKYVDTIDKRKRSGQEIVGPARHRLIDEIKSAVELARDYLAMKSAESAEVDQREQDQAREIATRLVPEIENALAGIDQSMSHEENSTALEFATLQAKEFMQRALRVFDPNQPVHDSVAVPAIGVDAGLLKLISTTIEFSEGDDSPLITRATGREYVRSLSTFFAEREQQKDLSDFLKKVENFDSSRVYLRYIEGMPPDSPRYTGLEKTIRERRQPLRQEIERQCDSLAAELERMVIVGAIDDGERERLLIIINGVKTDVSQSNNFAALKGRLRRTTGEINAANEKARKTLDQTVKQLLTDGKVSEEEAKIIRAELHAGDFILANERIGLVERGVPFVPREQTDIFNSFYDVFLKDIDDDWKGLPGLIATIKSGKTYRKLQYPQLSKEQTQRGTALLERWMEASRARHGKGKGFDGIVEAIATILGFTDVQLEPKRASYGKRYLLRSRRVEGREQCPVPAYGSEADGRYQLLCLWDRPSESDIVNAVGDTTADSPIIVFHFGGVNHYRRASLSQLGRSQRKRFVVIDDYLIAYLSAQEASYLSVMFRLALPFAFLEPFTTSAGTVPPEMFYGRSAEIESIMDPLGSSFIFGGRQLGKTALLREVRRRYHHPSEGRVAIYLDLERDIVDKSRVYEDFWSLVRKRLVEIDLIRNLPNHTLPDTVIQHMRRWIDEEDGRRLLLLVDEADRFLEHDSRIGAQEGNDVGGTFAETRRLQQVMNDTNRRFKVVFAGLHQVQRVTKDVNQPLAHLGQPLQIGPLNRKTVDLQDALALVKEPLLNVGYQLNDETALKILTEANYYPSLIQLYGKALVGNLNRSNVWKDPQNRRPRYNVEKEKIDSIRVDQDLQSQIRDRFRWTLQLDPRYEFTANVIAWATLDDRSRLTSGFAPSEVTAMVRDWWPAGFANLGVQEMSVLLLEMEGLGVLRSDSTTGKFSLRNQSLLGLIGSSAEIETFLLGDHAKPAEYLPSRYRKEYAINGVPFLAPLADGEISELFRAVPSATIVTGGPLSDFQHVSPFLDSIANYVDRLEAPVMVSGCHTVDDFRAFLSDAIRQSKADKQLLTVVPDDQPWSLKWIDAGGGILSRYKERPLHIIFLADHYRLWQLIEDANGSLPRRLERSKARLWSRLNWGDYELTQLKNVLRRGWSDKQMDQLKKVSSGWASVLESGLSDLVGDEQDNWDVAIDRIFQMIHSESDFRRAIVQSYRSIPAIGELYAALAEYGSALRSDEIQELLGWEDSPNRLVDFAIEWGQLVGELQETSGDGLILDPTVAAFFSGIPDATNRT